MWKFLPILDYILQSLQPKFEEALLSGGAGTRLLRGLLTSNICQSEVCDVAGPSLTATIARSPFLAPCRIHCKTYMLQWCCCHVQPNCLVLVWFDCL